MKNRVLTIDPQGLEVVEWADWTGSELQPFGDVPRLDDADRWREWAYAVIQNRDIANCQPPDPQHFGDWREWADRFNQTIYALSN